MNWLADKLADWLATMICFWIISVVTLGVLFYQSPKNMVDWIFFLSSGFFQAVALPVLAFVSKKEGKTQAALLQETHDAVMEELKQLKAICQFEEKEAQTLDMALPGKE